MKSRALFVTLSGLTLSLVVLDAARADDQKALWTPQQIRSLSFDLGANSAEYVLRVAAKHADDEFSLNMARHGVRRCADALGVSETNYQKSHSQQTTERMRHGMNFLFDDKQNRAANQLRQKHGEEAANLYRWGLVVGMVEVAAERKGLSLDALHKLATTHGAKPGVPAGLTKPLLTALKDQKSDLRTAVEDCRARAEFYCLKVLNQVADIKELDDPDFYKKYQQQLAERQAKRDKDRLEDEKRMAEAYKKSQEDAIVKDIGKATSDTERTNILLDQLMRQANQDEFDHIGRRLREIGPNAVPTLCRRLINPHASPDRSVPAVPLHALQMVLFDLRYAEAKDGVSSDEAARLKPSGLQALVNCAADSETTVAASGLLRVLSVSSGDAAIKLLLKRHQQSDDAQRERLAATLDGIATDLIDRAFQRLSELKSEPQTASIADNLVQRELVSIRQMGGLVQPAVVAAAAQVDERSAQTPAFVSVLRVQFLERTDLIEPTPVNVLQEKYVIIEVWGAAIRKVNLNDPFFAITRKNIGNADVKIRWYIEMLGEDIVIKKKVTHVADMFTFAINDNARQAGRMAANHAILRDLKQLLEDRETAAGLYQKVLFGAAFKSLNADQQALVKKHNLVTDEIVDVYAKMAK